ncbi:MAG: DUF4369 domain-containing protein [Muribaculaceae bacterium]|nr:DUF4369 domain-containing protein [Muribaculaceae bacterium]
MRSFFYSILLILGGLLLTCCEHRAESDGAFEVTVTLHNGRVLTDSATLVMVDDDYELLRVLDGARLQDSSFSFVGHSAVPRIAFIDFVTDSLPYQFYFILEPGKIEIELEPGHWLIKSTGHKNLAFLSFLDKYQRVERQRQALWERYRKMAADSTLTWDKEREAVRADSLLQDSLQRITVDRINQGDLVSLLVKQRLMHTLTHESLKQLKE